MKVLQQPFCMFKKLNKLQLKMNFDVEVFIPLFLFKFIRLYIILIK